MTSVIESLSGDDFGRILSAVNSREYEDDPRVVALRRGFVEDEVQVARWTAHDRTPLPVTRDRRYGQAMLRRVMTEKQGENDE